MCSTRSIGRQQDRHIGRQCHCGILLHGCVQSDSLGSQLEYSIDNLAGRRMSSAAWIASLIRQPNLWPVAVLSRH